jgi:hypothetical protein
MQESVPEGRDRIEDRLDRGFPEAWKPAPGDKLVGTVTEVGERDGGFGSYPIIGVLTDAGDEFNCHAYHTVLRNEVAKQRPRVGDRIGIAYHGKKDGEKDGEKGYERYRVIVEHAAQPDTEPDWDRHASEAQAELDRAEEPPPGDDDAW